MLLEFGKTSCFPLNLLIVQGGMWRYEGRKEVLERNDNWDWCDTYPGRLKKGESVAVGVTWLFSVPLSFCLTTTQHIRRCCVGVYVYVFCVSVFLFMRPVHACGTCYFIWAGTALGLVESLRKSFSFCTQNSKNERVAAGVAVPR